MHNFEFSSFSYPYERGDAYHRHDLTSLLLISLTGTGRLNNHKKTAAITAISHDDRDCSKLAVDNLLLIAVTFSALTLLVGWQEKHPAR